MSLPARATLSLLYVAACVWTLRAEDAAVERRAPAMGFMGMRGKKDSFDDKRTPNMGFAAMRGKKDTLFDFADYYPDYKRGAQGMGFMGMRGKKDFDPEYDFDLGADKRVPSMGFAAMRGKKAPSGFMGMRGKKFDYSDDDFLDDDSWPMDEFEKRAPAAGFYGTRGKKMPQSSGFFGMRGKKGPSGFFGMRGKKGPSSGFMGVRGKKDGEDLENLLALLTEQHGERNKRDEHKQITDSTAFGQGVPESLVGATP